MALRPVLVLLLLLCGGAAAIGPIDHYGETRHGAGWSSFRLEDIAADTSVFLAAKWGQPWQTTFFIYDAEGRIAGPVMIGLWTGTGFRAMANSPEVTPFVVEERDEAGEIWFAVGFTFDQPAAGPFYFAALAVGDGVTWRTWINGHEEILPAGLSEGDSVLWFDGAEWGAAGAYARVPRLVASASVGAERSLDVEGRLLGPFGVHGIGQSRGDMTVSDGATTRVCPCLFNEVVGEAALGPGSYDVHVTGASVRSSGPILAMGDISIQGLTHT